MQAALFYDLALSSVMTDRNCVYGIGPPNKTIIRNRRRICAVWVGHLIQLVYCALSIKFSDQTFKEIHLKELTFFLPKLPSCYQTEFLQIYQEGNTYQGSPLAQHYVQLAVSLGCFIQATRQPFTATTLLFLFLLLHCCGLFMRFKQGSRFFCVSQQQHQPPHDNCR